jgi:hypothetical protein
MCRWASFASSAALLHCASCEEGKQPEKGTTTTTTTSTTTTTTTSSSTSSSTSNKGRKPAVEWAYPSPYDANIPIHRFASVHHLKQPSSQWDLKELVRLWDESGEETWPW